MEQNLTRSVFIGMPAHDNVARLPTVTSLLDGLVELAHGGMAMTLFSWRGDSLLCHARNVILAEFLKSDATDLVFVDSDVGWQQGALRRLVEHPVDFVAGVYRRKADEEGYPVNYLPKAELWADKDTGLLEVADVPMGFAKLTRKAVEQLTEASKDFPFRHQNAPDLQCYRVFDYEYKDGQYFGEDYVFCRKWRELGGKVWVDPEIQTIHSGNKDYDGHFGNWLRSRGNTPSRIDPADLKRAFADVAAAVQQAAA